MIVVDTGSVDSTPEIAAELGAAVHHFPWCDDFSAARNVSLEKATGEWLFWMDSDDTIDEENGRKLRCLADQPHDPQAAGYVVQVHCPGGDQGLTVVDHVKVIRSDPRLRFEFRIHEQLLPAIRRVGGQVGWTDIFVVHSGADQSPEGRAGKYERDLRILHLELRDRPDHPFALFNLGMTYLDMERFADAIGPLERSIALSAPSDSQVRKAYAMLTQGLDGAGRASDALAVCERGLALYPEDAELHFRRAMLAQADGSLENAAAHYRQALAPPRDRQFSSFDPGVAGYKACHNLALVHEQRGDLDRAEVCWREVLRLCPEHPAGNTALVRLLLLRNRLVAAEFAIEQMEARLGETAASASLRARLASAQGQKPEALDLVAEAERRWPDNIDVLEAKCQVLFLFGAPDEAETALLELAAAQPENAAARHNLAVLLADQERLEEARRWADESLELRPDHSATLELIQSLEATESPVA